MNAQRTIRGNFAWTLAGNVLFAGCQWGIVLVLARLGSPEMIGQYSLALALTGPIFMFSNLQLRTIQATDARESYAFGHYFALRMITVSLSVLAVIAIILFNPYSLSTISVLMLITAGRIFDSMSDVIYGLLQQHERMDLISRSMMVKGILALLGMVAILLSTGNIVLSMSAIPAASLFVLLALDIRKGRKHSHIGMKMEWRTLGKLVRLSLPLGGVMLLISLNDSIPKYFTQQYLNMDALGYLSALLYLAVAGNTIVNALGQSVSTRLARYYAALKIDDYKRLMLRLIGFGILIGIAGIVVSVLFGKQLLTLIYSAQFEPYADLLILVMVSAAVTYIASLLGYGMTSARYFKIQPYMFAILNLLNVSLLVLLVPRFQLEGVVYTLLLTSVAQIVLTSFVLFHAIRKNKRMVVQVALANETD